VLDQLDTVERELAGGQSSQRGLLLEASKCVQHLRSHMVQIRQETATMLASAQTDLSEIDTRWREARKPLDEAIRKVKQELGEQSLDPDRLIWLTTEQARLDPQLGVLQVVQIELDDLLTERQRLLGGLRDARQRVSTLRSQEADSLSQRLRSRVRVAVEDKGQRAEFRERLVAFFQGSGLDHRSIEKLAAVDGYAIAEKVRTGPEALEKHFGISAARAQQISSFLNQDNERLYDLELLGPDDDVHVYLRLTEVEQSLERLSAGQRATAMLLLLLAQDDRLLLVDQPEDDLDNRFIYEDIVRILREQKGQRQLIAATHNPNIPVLGNAELVVALEDSESQARVAVQGGIDKAQVCDFVKNAMEGGEDAFRRRAQKYGWMQRGNRGLPGTA